jgi:hypothetical protein
MPTASTRRTVWARGSAGEDLELGVDRARRGEFALLSDLHPQRGAGNAKVLVGVKRPASGPTGRIKRRSPNR